jgi:hypothetical protein
MKMLSKENLIARTSDIGFCLGLLAGKILIVGFVVASAYGSSGAGEISHKDILFSDKSELQLKRLAAQAMNANAVLEKSAELLQQQLALQEQETKLLQEQLSKQSASSSEEDVRERKALLRERNALLSENKALQQKLDAVQSGRQTPSDIAAEIECLLTKDALSEGPLIIENQKEKSSSLWGICCGAR